MWLPKFKLRSLPLLRCRCYHRSITEGGLIMTIDTKKTGAYIQMCRKLSGLTQMQLGERLHVTGQSVSNWERGDSHS